MSAPRAVYLAARYSRRAELCAYRDTLAGHGITVTSRWLNGSHQLDNNGIPITDDGERRFQADDPAVDHLRQHFAAEDLADVLAADTLIAFTEPPRASASRGGRHVELGVALAAGKRVAVVGPRENVFCWLPQVDHHATWPDYLASLAPPAPVMHCGCGYADCPVCWKDFAGWACQCCDRAFFGTPPDHRLCDICLAQDDAA